MDEAPVRIGLLGAARIAPLALIEPARERKDVVLAAVAARDPERARSFADEHGFEGVCRDYAELIARSDIDLVYVALPPDLHCHWTIAALRAGKGVLCEKPFAMNAREAQQMVDASIESGAILLEAFHYRFHRMMRDAVALIRDGAIGRPTSATASVDYPIPTGQSEPRWSAEHGGGAMMDLGCYGVHALRSLLAGEPEVLTAEARFVRGVDAATDAKLLFPGGVEADLHASMDPAAPFTEIVIVGTRGQLQINGFVLPQRSGRARLTVNGQTDELPVDGPSSYAEQLDHAVRVFRRREHPLTGGEDAIANLRVIDRINALAREAAS
jgi:predicted dehydrogenase